MKNRIKNFFKIVAISAGCLLFASFSPSLDGRAVVVDSGVFPQGLFAKTVGYLPGDIISVTNIAGDKTIDLLVIGALDPSEGVAIMLSPEAADAMGIDRSANNIVKITKRSGQDERVYGNAVISKAAADVEDWDDEDFENISAEENSEAFEEPEETEAPVAENMEDAVEEDFAEEAAETEKTEEAEEAEAEVAEEESFEKPEESEAVEEESFDEEAVDETEVPEETEEAFDEEALSEEESVAEEESFEEESFEDEEIPEAEAAPVEESAEEVAEEEPEGNEEAVEEEAFDSEELEALPEEAAEETEEETEAPAEETEEESVDEEAFDEDKPEELPLASENTVAEEEEKPAAEAFDEDELEALPEETEETSEAESEEEYEAIVLVPVDSNPPAGDSDEVEDVVSEDELDAIDEEINLTPISESSNSVSAAVQNEAVETKPVSGNATSYDKYMVPSLKNLESGKYYIQIAAYGSDENILDVINKYGNNYPITLVPMAGGKTKQVLIGPVSVDEYKVVLERFKSYGFKDAFLRKIK